MLIRLLLDENISPRVARILATEDGVDACHVRDRGMLEATDQQVLARAFAEDRILVTKNVADFLKLARATEIHSGILMLGDGALGRDDQLRTIRRAVATIAAQAIEMVNQVVSVGIDGIVTIEEIPRRD